MNTDLTVGNPEKVLWKFCLPLFGSIIFQQLYNLADSFVVGKYVGEQALAAVGNSYEITLIFIAFAFGCNIGTSVITARFFGAKDYSNMKTAISTSMITSALICLALMLVGILGDRLLLNLIHTPEEVLTDSRVYLDIYVWGLPFVFFYNLSTGIFSALGDSRTPFYFLVISSLSNIFVDIFFVTGLHMGVSGVAWATFLCQGVSCFLAMFTVIRRMKNVPAQRASLFDLKILKQFLVIAIPSILQQSFISIGNIIIQGVINGFGSGVMAGYSAGVKLNNLVITSFTTIGNGISNYTSQNLGAGKMDRINSGFKAGIKMIWCLSFPMALLYFIFPGALLHIFLDAPSADALSSGILYLRILAPFYFIVSAKLISDGILRGSGAMKEFMIGTFTDMILRVILAILLARTALGYVGIWCSWPVGWTIAAGISILFYRHLFLKK